MEFDDDGWLWLSGISYESRNYKLGAKNLIILRFNGQIFYEVSIPEKIIEGASNLTMQKSFDNSFYIKIEAKPARVTEEQFSLLSQYLNERHHDGSMASMTIHEYADMVETSPVSTTVIEYRRLLDQKLMAVGLTDELSDGLSMVYSFFDIKEHSRSLGTYIILNHIERAKIANQQFVYLGYWVKGSPKMDYKRRFKPLERLGQNGWYNIETDDLVT